MISPKNSDLVQLDASCHCQKSVIYELIDRSAMVVDRRLKHVLCDLRRTRHELGDGQMKECCIVIAVKSARNSEAGAKEAVNIIDLFRSGTTSCSINGRNCEIKNNDETLYKTVEGLGRSDIVQYLKGLQP